jgi:hypothetical protein
MVITNKKLITPNKLNIAYVLSVNNLLVALTLFPLNIDDNNIIICIAKNTLDNNENVP